MISNRIANCEGRIANASFDDRAYSQLATRNSQFKFVIGLCALLVLISCNLQGEDTSLERLAPCTASGTVFAQFPFDQWPSRYHDTVREVTNAHMEGLDSTSAARLQCDATSYQALATPSGYLRALAQQLAPWKTPEKLATLSETDFGPVLLEFLRTYECSLHERNNFLPVIRSVGGVDRGEYERTIADDRRIIQRELLVSRPTLERLLTLVGAFDRLRPLSTDIECIKRASLDLRNVVGLTADAVSCMPRIWDARGSLRDIDLEAAD